MKLSVLQQKPCFGYDQLTQAPSLELLKAKNEETLNETFAMLDEAGQKGSDLAVTIEGVNMTLCWADMRYPYPEVYEGLDGALVRRFSDKAKQWKMHIVAGLYLTIEGSTYNCAVLFDDEGKIVGIHKKVHLPAGEEFQVANGDKIEVFDTKLGKIGMLVCWDMQFPEAPRIQAMQGAELICLPTWGWENIYGLCRAYENSVTVAAAMGIDSAGGLPEFCDPSCIVDNMGKIVAAAPREGSCVVTAEVDIHAEPAPQYGSEHYKGFPSMRRTRASQRHPELYGELSTPIELTGLYKRYE